MFVQASGHSWLGVAQRRMELVRVVSDNGLYFREIILPGNSNEEQYKSLR
jgi:hypothetical protein